MSFFLGGRAFRRPAFIFGIALIGGLAGCGDDPPARTDLPYHLYCDIGDGDCQRQIYYSLATMLNEDPFDPPAIRTISVAQHEEEVRGGLNLDDLSGEDAETRGLRLMGFIPEVSESVTATQVEYFITQVAAYYSRRDQSITVIDREYEEIDAQSLLAHEFTHAIQDKQFDLNDVSADADTEDGVMGVRGVIEGDAVHSSFAWVYEQLGYLPEEIDWGAIFGDWQSSSRSDAGDSEVALIDSASSFPYAFGSEFMASSFFENGLSARAAAFRSPPGSAVDLMAGYGASLPVFEFPTVAHPAPLDDHSVEVENRFGAWYVYGFLRRRGVSDAQAWTAALSWIGDELAIYQSDSEVVAVWRLRFDETPSADLLLGGVIEDARGVATAALPHAGEVFVFASESVESLQAWAARPLQEVQASFVPKRAVRRGGAVSVGKCLQSLDFSLPNPPPLLH